MAHQVCTRQIREDEALHAIKAARSFASLWLETAIHAGLNTTNDVKETLDRLSQAELFHLKDEEAFSSIKQALVQRLNVLGTFVDGKGYGDFAIANDTAGDMLFTDNFKSARRLIEHWKTFKHARQRIIDRRQAARIADA
jgi:hypothetical protein